MSVSIAMNAAVQGMTAQSVRFQHLGNNIANSTTVAYKSSDVGFAEAMALGSNTTWPDGAKVQPGAGVITVGTQTNFTGGQIRDDQVMSHIAIVGEGYFTVELSGNELLTRAGDFSIIEQTPETGPGLNDGTYVMMRSNGAILQGQAVAGGPLTGNVTFTGRPSDVTIATDGTVTTLPLTVAVTNSVIGTRRFLNQNALIKQEGQMFRETAEATPFTIDPEVPGMGGSGILRQGSLEQSNVDLTTEFTKMIVTQTAFTANSKTITTADEMLNTVLNLLR